MSLAQKDKFGFKEQRSPGASQVGACSSGQTPSIARMMSLNFKKNIFFNTHTSVSRLCNTRRSLESCKQSIIFEIEKCRLLCSLFFLSCFCNDTGHSIRPLLRFARRSSYESQLCQRRSTHDTLLQGYAIPSRQGGERDFGSVAERRRSVLRDRRLCLVFCVGVALQAAVELSFRPEALLFLPTPPNAPASELLNHSF